MYLSSSRHDMPIVIHLHAKGEMNANDEMNESEATQLATNSSMNNVSVSLPGVKEGNLQVCACLLL
jgi:hypothetical protein